MIITMEDQEVRFQLTLVDLEVSANNFAMQFIGEPQVRREYNASAKKFCAELKDQVKRKKISVKAAADKAASMRNTIMDAARGRSSSFGLALARFLKKEGLTSGQLEEKYAEKLFYTAFKNLNNTQKGDVWRVIINKSGEPSAKASNGAKWLGRAGKGFFVLTATIAVYNIVTSENKVRATANECVNLGAGAAGAYGGGAAGLLCGPGAIVCVPLGVFIGGVLGAWGADLVFDQIWK